jgi:hypothetical protein
MKKKFIAVAGTAAVLMATSLPAFSLGWIPKDPPPPGGGTRPTVAAPEIDVSAGAKGLAVLVAGMLLVGERLRRR